jgi:hypothetical protein
MLTLRIVQVKSTETRICLRLLRLVQPTDKLEDAAHALGRRMVNRLKQRRVNREDVLRPPADQVRRTCGYRAIDGAVYDVLDFAGHPNPSLVTTVEHDEAQARTYIGNVHYGIIA